MPKIQHKSNSNTTLVKVKCRTNRGIQEGKLNSNTTLVKVKFYKNEINWAVG